MNRIYPNKNIDDKVLEDLVLNKLYFPNTYYNSLDFMYKYTKEVILNNLFNLNKDYFKKITSNLEQHRYARMNSINNNALYNSIYPNLYINVIQDFSGPGKRTTMAQASLLYILDPDMMMRTIFSERSISIQLSSNIYKYEVTLISRFDTSMGASNFISKLYNRLHINKHFYPDYSNLKYRVDKAIYRTIRKAYQAEYDNDEDFLNYMDKHTKTRFIKEFDKATGNFEYYMLLPIRPLVRINPPTQQDDNSNGLRESIVTLSLELEIELPGSLYFTAPALLVKEVIVDIDTLTVSEDIKIQKEKQHQSKNTEYHVIKEDNLVDVNQKLVIMPEIKSEDMYIEDYEDLYTATLSIDDLSDLISIDDKVFIKYLYYDNTHEKNKYVLKIYDETGNEIVPKEVRPFEKSIDIILVDGVEDTIITIKLFKKVLKIQDKGDHIDE